MVRTSIYAHIAGTTIHPCEHSFHKINAFVLTPRSTID